jgi:N-carbamoylputrescine amidase
VAAVNRIGTGNAGGRRWPRVLGAEFRRRDEWQILAKASVDREEIMLVPVDLGQVDTTRTHWPFLRDRRIDAYGDLTRRFLD